MEKDVLIPRSPTSFYSIDTCWVEKHLLCAQLPGYHVDGNHAFVRVAPSQSYAKRNINTRGHGRTSTSPHHPDTTYESIALETPMIELLRAGLFPSKESQEFLPTFQLHH